MSTREVYWFRLPDDLDWLFSLPPSELKIYVLLSRDIQKGKTPGELSIREIAKDVGVVFQTAQTAVTNLVDQGRVIAKKRPGDTTVYSLPFTWATTKGKKKQIDQLPGNGPSERMNYSRAAEQSEEKSERHYSPDDVRNYSRRDEQPKTIRNPESLEPLESTTTAAPEIGSWTPELIEQARERMRQHRRARFVPDLKITYQVLEHMLDLADLELWLETLNGIKFTTLWGFHLDSASNWTVRRADIRQQLERERVARRKEEDLAEAEWEKLQQQMATEDAAA